MIPKLNNNIVTQDLKVNLVVNIYIFIKYYIFYIFNIIKFKIRSVKMKIIN